MFKYLKLWREGKSTEGRPVIRVGVYDTNDFTISKKFRVQFTVKYLKWTRDSL